MLEILPTNPDGAPRPERAPEHYQPMQAVTRSIAFGDGWNADRKQQIFDLFNGLAPEWNTIGANREGPLRDALRRSGIGRGGVCVEVGSGTGMQTPPLIEHFDRVLSLDLAPAMLGFSARLGAVTLGRADASLLPVRSESVDAIVAVNMFLFPSEYLRVLRPGGRLVFVSTSGDHTPIYLPSTDVFAAVSALVGENSAAVASQLGHSTWTVITKEAR